MEAMEGKRRGNGRNEGGDKVDGGEVNGRENDDIIIELVCQHNVQNNSESENIMLKVVNGDKSMQRKKKCWGIGKGTLEVVLNIGIVCDAALVMIVSMAWSTQR
ncbi:hypothetical protein CsSME_00000716 [Camellia sinensis var. sinensis]